MLISFFCILLLMLQSAQAQWVVEGIPSPGQPMMPEPPPSFKVHKEVPAYKPQPKPKPKPKPKVVVKPKPVPSEDKSLEGLWLKSVKEAGFDLKQSGIKISRDHNKALQKLTFFSSIPSSQLGHDENSTDIQCTKSCYNKFDELVKANLSMSSLVNDGGYQYILKYDSTHSLYTHPICYCKTVVLTTKKDNELKKFLDGELFDKSKSKENINNDETIKDNKKEEPVNSNKHEATGA